MEIITHQKPQKKEGLISRLLSATPDQARDTGMALALLCLLIVQFKHAYRVVPVAIILLIITMAWPRAFQPLAGLWFGLSHVLGTVMSKVLLTLVFFLVVTPIGLVRRFMGKDSLQLKKFKKGQDSVFLVRSAVVEKEDLHKPY
jgi:Saxitoxin biosynthesis operon protein SxtJ